MTLLHGRRNKNNNTTLSKWPKYCIEACSATTATGATAASMSLYRWLGHLVNIERAHVGSGTAADTIAAYITCNLSKLLFPYSASTACAAIGTACADACTGTAAAVAAATAVTRLYPVTVKYIFCNFVSCISALKAIAAVGRLATCGDNLAAADEAERVALRQFNARTGTRGSVSIGTRTGNGLPRGDEEMHRA